MAEFTYSYTREKVDKVYKIDNPDRVDGEGKQIYLADEIQTAFPSIIFQTKAVDTNFDVIVQDTALTEGQQTTLGTLVSDHKDNN